MVNDIFGIFEIIFSKCVEWSTSLFESTGATPFYVAAVIVVFVVTFLVLPLRGGGITINDSVADFTRQATYSGKHYNGRTVTPAKGYKGKYEKRPAGGHRATPKF